MKIISFIESRQADVLRNILEHCGLWETPPAPPATVEPDARRTIEPDGDYEDHRRREAGRQQAFDW